MDRRSDETLFMLSGSPRAHEGAPFHLPSLVQECGDANVRRDSRRALRLRELRLATVHVSGQLSQEERSDGEADSELFLHAHTFIEGAGDRGPLGSEAGVPAPSVFVASRLAPSVCSLRAKVTPRCFLVPAPDDVRLPTSMQEHTSSGRSIPKRNATAIVLDQGQHGSTRAAAAYAPTPQATVLWELATKSWPRGFDAPPHPARLPCPISLVDQRSGTKRR